MAIDIDDSEKHENPTTSTTTTTTSSLDVVTPSVPVPTDTDQPNPDAKEVEATPQDAAADAAVDLERSGTRASSGVEYSVFSTGLKQYIVIAASMAGFFSPLSSQIYFPALNTLAEDLHVSISLINLTMTSYMVMPLSLPSSFFFPFLPNLLTVLLLLLDYRFSRALHRFLLGISQITLVDDRPTSSVSSST